MKHLGRFYLLNVILVILPFRGPSKFQRDPSKYKLHFWVLPTQNVSYSLGRSPQNGRDVFPCFSHFRLMRTILGQSFVFCSPDFLAHGWRTQWFCLFVLYERWYPFLLPKVYGIHGIHVQYCPVSHVNTPQQQMSNPNQEQNFCTPVVSEYVLVHFFE